MVVDGACVAVQIACGHSWFSRACVSAHLLALVLGHSQSFPEMPKAVADKGREGWGASIADAFKGTHSGRSRPQGTRPGF
jgi:hypothetical protein